jgi:type IV secretory pathway VirJ component
MARKSSIVTIAAAVLWLSATPPAEAAALAHGPSEQQIKFPGVGPVMIFRPPSTAESLALFLSPAAGWSEWDTAVARQLAKADTLVAGIDTRQFLAALNDKPGECVDPAAPLEDLTTSLKKDFAIREFIQSMIVGHTEGAIIAYNALAQSNHHSFKGGLAMEFCPVLQNPRPLCGARVVNRRPGSADPASTTFGPASQLAAPLNVLQPGQLSCTADAAAFLAASPGLTVIPFKGDRGAWVTQGPRNQLVDAYWQIAGTDSSLRGVRKSADSIADLPLTEIRNPSRAETDSFAIFLSGDGGWADLDQGVAKELAKRGIPVVGLSSLKYFWTPRKPEELAADISRVASHYLDAWQKSRFLIAGYSFGADVSPFIPKMLPPDLADKLIGVGLIAPSRNASFEFHLSDWLGIAPSGSPTAPAIASLQPTPVACIYGADDSDAVCPDLAKDEARIVRLSGDHHFNGNYIGIANGISTLRK